MSSNVIGRESERSNILDFVANCEAKTEGGVLYCAGAPGTGKTLCVQNVLNGWVKEKSCKANRRYDYVNVIGLNDHLRLFTSIESLMRGKSFVSQIRKRGRSNAKINDNAEPFAMVADCVDSVVSLGRSYDGTPTTCVLVIDELDYLCPALSSVTRGGNSKSVINAKKQLDLVRSLFSIPQKLALIGSKITLVIIGIANSIDLSEKLTSLSGSSKARRLVDSTLLFRPYEAAELKAIVNQITNNSLDPDALELCARKVATVHGDCRKVIDLCKQATNNKRRRTPGDTDNGSKSATIADLLPAMDGAFKSHSESVTTLKSLPLQQLFVLVAACRHAVAHSERSDFPISDLKTALGQLVRDLNVPSIDVGQVSTMMEHVMALSNCGFMTLKSKGSNQVNVVRSDMFWRLNTPSEKLQDTLMKTNAVIAYALGGGENSTSLVHGG